MPGQSYLFEIVEESSFLLCIIQAFQMIAVTAVLIISPSASPSLAIAEHGVLYIY
jgi:hypothetical protein